MSFSRNWTVEQLHSELARNSVSGIVEHINQLTGMGFGDSLRAAEDREGWKGIVAASSVVPRRPSRLRD